MFIFRCLFIGELERSIGCSCSILSSESFFYDNCCFLCSRKRFSEQQAEKWWVENRSRIQEKYTILSGENSASGSTSAHLAGRMACSTK